MDPDARPVDGTYTDFGDGPITVRDPKPGVAPSLCPPQYGPWTPPDRAQGSVDSSPTYTYPAPGTYQVRFGMGSAVEECNNPYSSGKDFTATVVVS